MIKPYDLIPGSVVGRIGHADEFRILEIRMSSVMLESGHGALLESTYKQLLPIPLIVSRLPSLNFTTQDAGSRIFLWDYKDEVIGKNFKLISDSHLTPTKIYFEFSMQHEDERIELRFIHQLQQLFVAIAGTEIKFQSLSALPKP